jgi:hypothetical protein
MVTAQDFFVKIRHSPRSILQAFAVRIFPQLDEEFGN